MKQNYYKNITNQSSILCQKKGSQSGSSLDKLAQLGCSPQTADEQGGRKLEKRARLKNLTKAITGSLHRNNPTSFLRKSYRNSYHCCDNISIQEDGITAKYCKNRFCLVCARVKVATMINKFMPVMESFHSPQFVTLTIPNVQDHKLKETIELMQSKFRQIIHRNSFRGKFKGIRKLECTYNPISKTYHPHFHLIIDGKVESDLLLKTWLELFPSAKEIAQDVREADKGSMIELCKYTTKVMVSDKNSDKKVYTTALDVIFRSMYRKRVIQGFGMPKTKDIEDDYEKLNEIMDDSRYGLWEWEQEITDWINKSTGERLTGYEISSEMKEIIKGIV